MRKRTQRILAIALAGTMMMGIAGCGSAAKQTDANQAAADSAAAETTSSSGNQDAIQIATKPMTEQFILSEMLKLVIEQETGYPVEITKGIGGGTNNIMPAMEKGEFDLYPEYTSSGYVMVLDHDASQATDEEIQETLDKEYAEKFNMSWVGSYGFNNTYAVAVSTPVAEQYELKTTSDLAPVSGELVFGGNGDYIERADGFHLVCDTYGLEFKDVKDIDIGLKYEALFHGDIDVTNGFTTDAQLSDERVTVLEDDKHLQVNYFCSTVVRNEALEEYPGLEEAIHKLDNCLSDQEMAGLNAKVEIDGEDEADVAKAYLTEKGIIE